MSVLVNTLNVVNSSFAEHESSGFRFPVSKGHMTIECYLHDCAIPVKIKVITREKYNQ